MHHHSAIGPARRADIAFPARLVNPPLGLSPHHGATPVLPSGAGDAYTPPGSVDEAAGGMNYAEARRRMVDGQVRPNRVTDHRILRAMQEVPRELFVPENLRVRSLSDEDLALGGGRVLLQPMVIAQLLQLAEPRPAERVLLLASGTGYGAALLAHMGCQVVAVEDDKALLELAGPALAASDLPAGAIRQHQGNPAAGFPDGAPYDLILIEGAVSSVPPALVDQLTDGGRLVAIRCAPGEAGSAIIGRRVAGHLSIAEAFDVRGTPIPAFAPKPGFQFV
ncbi:protein-L-isoaspartate O-methyltransferase family protein [Roseomonas xinghualingensis]|uniref:protein-L-isoaspartate O-methyltransferase family protein n=1 Tax=Roseomonas xinghualingensis TaxID=2986475 RepID=UPI0021F231BC|nr:protein-L-isoaspartate O-methyltransferase [Roseomonas sp. SXEYE001]MCV4208618.1 protein-L-isoaspartate O-methyltransferase [Roseomonas sp. SXEYE001]